MKFAGMNHINRRELSENIKNELEKIDDYTIRFQKVYRTYIWKIINNFNFPKKTTKILFILKKNKHGIIPIHAKFKL